MGNGQSTSSGTKTLAKVARGDARAAQQVRLDEFWSEQVYLDWLVVRRPSVVIHVAQFAQPECRQALTDLGCMCRLLQQTVRTRRLRTQKQAFSTPAKDGELPWL